MSPTSDRAAAAARGQRGHPVSERAAEYLCSRCLVGGTTAPERKAAVALALLVERVAGRPTAEAW